MAACAALAAIISASAAFVPARTADASPEPVPGWTSLTFRSLRRRRYECRSTIVDTGRGARMSRVVSIGSINVDFESRVDRAPKPGAVTLPTSS